MVRFASENAEELGIWTELFVPSKAKAEPTTPVALAFAVDCRIPLLLPIMSFALPSAGHQPTTPEGTGTQAAAMLVSGLARIRNSARADMFPGTRRTCPKNRQQISNIKCFSLNYAR